MKKLKNAPVLTIFLLVLIWVAAVFIPARAQAKEIIAEGTYNMGDSETPDAAESRAIINAKRFALEQAGTYVRSYTKVKNATLTEDEIEVITSGIMEVSVIDKKRTIIGDGFKFWVKIKAVVQMEKIDAMAKRVKDRQVVEDYKRIKEAYDNSRQEIAELKKKLAEARSETEKKAAIASITGDELRLKATQWLDAGYRHMLSKDYDMAIEDLSKAISLTPENAMAYNFRGIAYDKKGKYDKAIYDYNRGISLNPDFAEAYSARGLTYSKKGEYDKAIENYSKGISLRLDYNIPDYAEDYVARGIAYTMQANQPSEITLMDIKEFRAKYPQYNDIPDMELAKKFHDKYYSDMPFDAFTQKFGISGKTEKGQYDKAIEDFSKAISLKPDYAEVYFLRGAAYSKKDLHDMAIEDFNRAISLMPDLAEAYNFRGFTYNKKGQQDRAIKDYNSAILLKPDFAEAYIGRGSAYNEKDQPDRAIKDYNRAISLKPDYAEAYVNRGSTYDVKGQYDRAIKDYDMAISLKPDYAVAYFVRGVAYVVRFNNFVKGCDDFERACTLGDCEGYEWGKQQGYCK